MTRQTIGGDLNLHALALLAELHRPSGPAALAAEAWRLITDGLTVEDVSTALGLSSAAVRALLVSESVTPAGDDGA